MFHRIENNVIVESVRTLPKDFRHNGVLYPLRQMWNNGAKDEVVALGWLPEEKPSYEIDNTTQKISSWEYDIQNDKVIAAPVIVDKLIEEIEAEKQAYRNNLKVSQRKARLVLLQAGVLNQMGAVIDSLPEPDKSAAMIEWEYAVEIKRTNPLVEALGPVLGFSDEQLDALFEQAMAIPD